MQSTRHLLWCRWLHTSMTGLSLPFTKCHRFIPARSRRTSKIYKYCLARVADLLAVPRDANSVAAVVLVVPQSQSCPWAIIRREAMKAIICKRSFSHTNFSLSPRHGRHASNHMKRRKSMIDCTPGPFTRPAVVLKPAGLALWKLVL